MKQRLTDLLENNPIIAGVKDEDGLRLALKSRCEVIFIYYGNICNIASIVGRIHQAGKYALVHIDLIEGTSNREIVVDFIKNTTGADGIISTRAAILRAARKKHLYTVHRCFLMDSMSFENLPRQHEVSQADIVEIVPGCIQPRVLRWVQESIPGVPIIASGLVCEKEFVVAALNAGVTAISTTCTDVWDEI